MSDCKRSVREKPQNDILKTCMHHLTAKPHAVNFVIALCLHNSGQEKENRIWSSFIWNSFCFPACGTCQRIGVWHKPLAVGNLGRNQRAVMSQTVGKYKSRTFTVYKSESETLNCMGDF